MHYDIGRAYQIKMSRYLVGRESSVFGDQIQTDQFTSSPQDQLEFRPVWRELIDTIFFVVHSTVEEEKNEKEGP